jgi:hypothetical protein
LKSLYRRVAALEGAARRGLEDKQLDLFVAALAGDPIATAQFEQLRGAVRGRLHELYDAIRIPLEAEGEWPSRVKEIDEQRPDC